MVKFGDTTLAGCDLVERLQPQQYVRRPYPGRKIPFTRWVGGLGDELLFKGLLTSDMIAQETTIKALADGTARIFDIEDGSEKILGIMVDPVFRKRRPGSGAIEYEGRVIQSGSLKTQLLCHFNGTDTATSTTDASHYARALTFYGTAQLDTAQKRFGSASLLLDGNSDYLSTPYAFDFGSDDFGIAVRLRWTTLPTAENQVIFSLNQASDYWFYICLLKSGGSYYWKLDARYAGAQILSLQKLSPGVVVDTWYDFELDRDGSSWYIFQDGVQCSTTATDADAFPAYSSSTPMMIGGRPNDAMYHNGHIDELLIVKGMPLHIADFTPAVVEYDADDF